MLKIIFDGNITSSSNIKIVCKKKKIERVSIFFTQFSNITLSSASGVANYPMCVGVYNNGIILRSPSAVNLTNGLRENVYLDGNFNFDDISILSTSELFNRVEIRNEYDVLITDNGRPWSDGTYPPDAKNRAEVAGLHASPAVINPELETALTGGEETNKERVQE